MRRIALLLVAALAFPAGLLLVAPDCASACSCAMTGGTPQQRAEIALSESTTVFAGEMVGVDPPSDAPITNSAAPVTVTFQVSEAWKGCEQDTLQVTTARSSVSCGYEFREGEEYLVYASQGNQVSLCSETKPLSKAAADLEVLGAGAEPEDEALPDTGGAPGASYPAPVRMVAAILAMVVGLALAGKFMHGFHRSH